MRMLRSKAKQQHLSFLTKLIKPKSLLYPDVTCRSVTHSQFSSGQSPLLTLHCSVSVDSSEDTETESALDISMTGWESKWVWSGSVLEMSLPLDGLLYSGQSIQ